MTNYKTVKELREHLSQFDDKDIVVGFEHVRFVHVDQESEDVQHLAIYAMSPYSIPGSVIETRPLCVTRYAASPQRFANALEDGANAIRKFVSAMEKYASENDYKNDIDENSEQTEDEQSC